MSKLIRGILPALCTPFDGHLALAIDHVSPLVRALIDARTNGFFVCGGTGEGRQM
ncbi:MAG TPA: N-acetylneuraminate lyase, partial [Candidatus Latescibacteria bacterium]|nr:N-acetylneuraminate lyase [Candidatus Latescibacterota bacterium]